MEQNLLVFCTKEFHTTQTPPPRPSLIFTWGAWGRKILGGRGDPKLVGPQKNFGLRQA